MNGLDPIGGAASGEGRLDRPLLALSLGLALVLLVPPILPWTVVVPGFTAQELADLFTPVIAGLGFLWVARRAGGFHGTAVAVAVALGAVWASAQGIHLAANAIRDAFDLPAQCAAAEAFRATTPGGLAHFLDEDLGHWLWHLPWAGLLVLLFAVAPSGGPVRGSRSVARLAGAIHGVVWFVVTTEGGTYLFSIPFAAVLLVLGWLGRDAGGARGALARFFLASGAVSLLAWAVWIGKYGWEPRSIFETLFGEKCPGRLI